MVLIVFWLWLPWQLVETILMSDVNPKKKKKERKKERKNLIMLSSKCHSLTFAEAS